VFYVKLTHFVIVFHFRILSVGELKVKGCVVTGLSYVVLAVVIVDKLPLCEEFEMLANY
jgi:hypothetical protein